MRVRIFFSILILLSISLGSCRKVGCTDENATNYCSACKKDDNSCNYIAGCEDPYAINYERLAQVGDGSCIYPAKGKWTTSDACYSYSATSYDMTLSSVKDAEYEFSNLGLGLFTNPVNLVILYGQVTIALQQPDGVGGLSIQGTGTIIGDASGQIMNLNFKVLDSDLYEISDCTLTATSL